MRNSMAGTSLVLVVVAATGCASSCTESYDDARSAYIEATNREIDLDLNEAVARGDFDRARELIAEGADIDAKYNGEGGTTNLIFVAGIPTDEPLRFLLEEGADPDLARNDGATALHVAAGAGRADNVAVLLEHGADRSRTDDAGRTPLDVAEEQGHADVADLLRASAEEE